MPQAAMAERRLFDVQHAASVGVDRLNTQGSEEMNVALSIHLYMQGWGRFRFFTRLAGRSEKSLGGPLRRHTPDPDFCAYGYMCKRAAHTQPSAKPHLPIG